MYQSIIQITCDIILQLRKGKQGSAISGVVEGMRERLSSDPLV